MNNNIIQESNQWIFIQQLGNGAFGTVSLFKNKNTNEYIALKKCNKQEDISDKAKKRWIAECEIMLQLDHINIVKGFPVDYQLMQLNHSPMPLLSMEYCESGDLRKILNLPENIFGLKENQVRAISRDTSSAIEYLHSKRIVHRDLKPDNIVIKKVNDKFIYKLIDLGYAKDLTGGSVCTSFVGTFHYLAPELFTNTKEYTRTVDYWSLGITIFECITGIRPFQHNDSPVAWLNLIQAKKSSHICFQYDNSKGEYSEKLPNPNHLCKTSQLFYEQWLRLMLRHESQLRGGEGESLQIRPKCFDMLDEIMSTKIIRIYKFETNLVTSIPIQIEDGVCNPSKISHLIKCLYQKIDGDEKIIFLDKNGNIINENDNPLNFCVQDMINFGDNDVDIFVFKDSIKFLENQNNFVQNTKVKKRPLKLTKLYEDSKSRLLSPQEILHYLKLLTYYSVELLNDAELINKFCSSVKLQKIAFKNTLKCDFENLKNLLLRLESKVLDFNTSIQLDIEKMRQNIFLDSENIIDNWMKQIEISEISEMQNNILQLETDYYHLNVDEDLYDLYPIINCISDVKDFYTSSKQSMSDNNSPKPTMEDLRKNLDIVIFNFCNINSKQLQLFKQYASKHNYLCLIREKITNLNDRLNKHSDWLLKMQLERQNTVWNLLSDNKNNNILMILENDQNFNEQTNKLCLESMQLQNKLKEILYSINS